MLRYVRGDNIELPKLGGSNLEESEKDIELNYVLQGTPLKGLALRVRNAWYRNDFAPQASHRDDNELRVNIDYTWKIL
ncbi:Porin D precursor [compost metagenome]